MEKMRESQYDNKKIFVWALIISLLILAIVGFCIGFFSAGDILDSNGFNKCEEIARYIHDNPNTEEIKLPEGYSSKEDGNKIIVKKDDYVGHVEATVRNGELTVIHVDGIYDKIMYGIWGAIITLVFIAVICLIASFVNKQSDSN